MTDILKELAKPFHPSAVKVRDGNHYVGIEDHIRRMNDTLGLDWDFSLVDVTIQEHPVRVGREKDKLQWLATAHGYVTLYAQYKPKDASRPGDFFPQSVVRHGVGCGVNIDPDSAIKTAQAEAFKKACNQFGMAGYLWSEDGREMNDLLAAVLEDDSAAAKKVLVAKAREAGVYPLTPATVAEHFKMGLNDDGRLPDDGALLAAKEMLTA